MIRPFPRRGCVARRARPPPPPAFSREWHALVRTSSRSCGVLCPPFTLSLSVSTCRGRSLRSGIARLPPRRRHQRPGGAERHPPGAGLVALSGCDALALCENGSSSTQAEMHAQIQTTHTVAHTQTHTRKSSFGDKTGWSRSTGAPWRRSHSRRTTTSRFCGTRPRSRPRLLTSSTFSAPSSGRRRPRSGPRDSALGWYRRPPARPHGTPGRCWQRMPGCDASRLRRRQIAASQDCRAGEHNYVLASVCFGFVISVPFSRGQLALGAPSLPS